MIARFRSETMHIMMRSMSNHPLFALTAAATLIVSSELASAEAAAAAQTSPTQSWLSSYFWYEKAKSILVEETTPTQDQVRFFGRPAGTDKKWDEDSAKRLLDKA